MFSCKHTCNLVTMAPFKCTQSLLFYDSEWDKYTDNIFIDVLAFQARMENFTWGETNFSAMYCAKEQVRKRTGIDWPHSVLLDRLRKLEERYTTFEWILSIPGVVFDPMTNIVHASPGTWDFIFKVCCTI